MTALQLLDPEKILSRSANRTRVTEQSPIDDTSDPTSSRNSAVNTATTAEIQSKCLLEGRSAAAAAAVDAEEVSRIFFEGEFKHASSLEEY